MDPNTFRIFASSRNLPIFSIGDSLNGGYFAGYISYAASGIATHALIVAPAATGASGTGYTLTTNYLNSASGGAQPTITNTYDGRLNTDEMIEIGISNFPAAQFCVGLSIGGFTDWYLPSLYELEIAYYNLKPTTQGNSGSYGANEYAVPVRTSNYSAGTPARTGSANFQDGGSQAFMASGHWTSTYDYLLNNTHRLSFANGESPAISPSGNFGSVRAFRKIAL